MERVITQLFPFVSKGRYSICEKDLISIDH
jgi:hypothetical protein